MTFRRLTVRRAVLAAALVWASVVLVLIVTATLHLRSGRRAARAAEAKLTAADVADPTAPDRLEPVRRHFARAHAELTNPLVLPLRLLPVLGRQLRAVSTLAGAATKAAVIGQSTVREARVALRAPHHTGPERLAAIRGLSAAASKADQALAGVDPGPGVALVGPVDRAHRQFVDRLTRLRQSLSRGIAGANGAASLLAGPRHVLVLMANNAEMRDGSGMFLSAASLDTSDGTLHLGQIHSTTDLLVPGGGVLPFAGDMADRWGWLHPNQEWRNLGLSPRFESTAALAARMWKAVQGDNVDGVIGLDVEALKAVLAGTGPIDLDGQTVSADNVEQLVMHDQYVGVPVDNTGQAARKERMGHIADAALHALQEGNFDIGHLSSALAGITGGRHLLVWSTVPAEQQAWRSAGVAGTLHADDLLVGVSNRGGNKLDQFLTVSSDLAIRTTPSVTELTVTVQLANHTPAGEPDYVIQTFAGSGIQPGDYLGLVSVTVPGAASGVTVEGSPAVNAYGRDGPTLVVAVQKVVRRGGRAMVVVHFSLPGRHGSMRVQASARVPAVPWAWIGGAARWTDDQGRAVRW